MHVRTKSVRNGKLSNSNNNLLT